MTHNETMLTVSLAALLGMPGTAHSGQAAPKGEAPTIEYLVKNVDFEINTQFQSGPNIKTEVSSNTKMVLTTSAIHNYSRDLLFVVVELDGYDQTKKDVPLNPAADMPPLERGALPLSGRRDCAVAAWFADEPWPGGTVRDFKLDVPVAPTVPFTVKSLSYTTHAAGIATADAVALLGDPVLPEDTREAVAMWLSRKAAKRYQYLTDDGRWILPKNVPETLARATQEEHATGVLRYVGAAARESELRVQNRTSTTKAFRVGGAGHYKWFELGPQKEMLIELEGGLLAITTRGNRYVTETVLVKPQAKYTLDFDR
jgi:hypothetical protein